MLARKRNARSRSCTLFGGQFSHMDCSERPRNFYLEVRTDYRAEAIYLGVQRYAPVKSPPMNPIW